MIWHLLRGGMIGFSIAAPVGPIGLLCIRRTLAAGRLCGIATGLGVATADGVYALIAGFGVSAASRLLLSGQFILQSAGGLFLMWLGWSIFMSKPAQELASAGNAGLARAYASTLLLTLSNPMTIMSFAGLIGALGTLSGSGPLAFAGGVFLGSTAWWLFLSWTVSLFRHVATSSRLIWINRLSGTVLGVYGLIAIVRSGRW